jgi:hypothetical protein
MVDKLTRTSKVEIFTMDEQIKEMKEIRQVDELEIKTNSSGHFSKAAEKSTRSWFVNPFLIILR